MRNLDDYGPLAGTRREVSTTSPLQLREVTRPPLPPLFRFLLDLQLTRVCTLRKSNIIWIVWKVRKKKKVKKMNKGGGGGGEEKRNKIIKVTALSQEELVTQVPP